jgi:hypothetical protein
LSFFCNTFMNPIYWWISFNGHDVSQLSWYRKPDKRGWEAFAISLHWNMNIINLYPLY